MLCCVVLVCSGATYIHTSCFLSIYLSRNWIQSGTYSLSGFCTVWSPSMHIFVFVFVSYCIRIHNMFAFFQIGSPLCHVAFFFIYISPGCSGVWQSWNLSSSRAQRSAGGFCCPICPRICLYPSFLRLEPNTCCHHMLLWVWFSSCIVTDRALLREVVELADLATLNGLGFYAFGAKEGKKERMNEWMREEEGFAPMVGFDDGLICC